MSLYDTYYTGSDVNIYLRYPLTDKQVHIDKALGIGYNHSMSSAPVYGLGNVEPLFFTRGNSLIQGNFDLSFKSTKYLQTGIKYLLDQGGLVNDRDKLIAKASTKGGLTQAEASYLSSLQSQTITTMDTISISQIFNLFEIVIEFDNSNATTDGSTSGLVLEGIKITSSAMGVYSTEESALVDRYTFLGKNIRELT